MVLFEKQLNSLDFTENYLNSLNLLEKNLTQLHLFKKRNFIANHLNLLHLIASGFE
jgi:hypothetical protein